MSVLENVGEKCLKCSYVRLAGDSGPHLACPQCQAVYAKLEKLAQEGRLHEAYRSKAAANAPRRAAASSLSTLPLPAQGTGSGLAPCIDCNRPVSLRAANCPHCGAPIVAEALASRAEAIQQARDARRPPPNRKLGWILAIGVPLIVLAIFTGPNEARPKGLCDQSAADGTVWPVRNYLIRNLRDPGSYESVEWSKVVRKSDGSFAVRHRYRAKNGFGALNLEDRTFQLNTQCDVVSG